jgi:hypothetical protein
MIQLTVGFVEIPSENIPLERNSAILVLIESTEYPTDSMIAR